jgi:hypothetical protein
MSTQLAISYFTMTSRQNESLPTNLATGHYNGERMTFSIHHAAEGGEGLAGQRIAGLDFQGFLEAAGRLGV